MSGSAKTWLSWGGKLCTHLIAKTTRISCAKFHCNGLTAVQDIQDYASLIFLTHSVEWWKMFRHNTSVCGIDRQMDILRQHSTHAAKMNRRTGWWVYSTTDYRYKCSSTRCSPWRSAGATNKTTAWQLVQLHGTVCHCTFNRISSGNFQKQAQDIIA